MQWTSSDRAPLRRRQAASSFFLSHSNGCPFLSLLQGECSTTHHASSGGGKNNRGTTAHQQCSFWHAKGSRLPIDTDRVKAAISIGPRSSPVKVILPLSFCTLQSFDTGFLYPSGHHA